jgi:hypothetical protein
VSLSGRWLRRGSVSGQIQQGHRRGKTSRGEALGHAAPEARHAGLDLPAAIGLTQPRGYISNHPIIPSRLRSLIGARYQERLLEHTPSAARLAMPAKRPISGQLHVGAGAPIVSIETTRRYCGKGVGSGNLALPMSHGR